MDFDHLVIKACQEISSAETIDPIEHDYRPRIKDKNSGRFFLIDTGAALSVIPKSMVADEVAGLKQDEGSALQAINGSKVPTFGTRPVKLRFDRKTFEHNMTVALVDTPILGWDIIVKYKFDLLWTNGQCVLFCAHSKSSYPLTLGRLNKNNLHLSPVTLDMSFKKYAQSQKSVPELKPVPTPYQKLIDKYPDILECRFLDQPLHGVIHHIETKDHPPCTAKVRPLLKGSPKETIGKKNWLELERLGVIEKIKPGEATPWSSALHLAPKDGTDLRVCGDFRALNDKTTLDTYPLPSLRTFASELQGAKIFSKVDLKRAFFQVPLDYET